MERPSYITNNEPFFVFRDRTPVRPENMRVALKQVLVAANLNPDVYSTHGFRSGCGCDLLKMGLSVESIKRLGRWSSNAVFTYLKYE